jgi:fido (protein-threonine AMPylation protein)/DNA-binding transcriptional regulator YiaG
LPPLNFHIPRHSFPPFFNRNVSAPTNDPNAAPMMNVKIAQNVVMKLPPCLPTILLYNQRKGYVTIRFPMKRYIELTNNIVFAIIASDMNNDIITQLREILHSSQWTQEQLAYNLHASFSTLNAWINGKATPRAKAVAAIHDLYISVVGTSEVDTTAFVATKKQALAKKMTVKKLLSNEQLLDKITLHLTYHTNTIEGSTMTLANVKEVLDDDRKVLANKTAVEQAEARNHRAALYYLLDELNAQGKNFQWTKELILQTHLRLMNTIISNAGTYRNHGVRIMGSHVTLVNHIKIPDFMDEIILDLNAKVDDIIETTAKLHARFENIHPFSDGNGRTGRLIMFIQALQNDAIPPLIIKERKQAYYRYLQMAQMDRRYDALTLFIAESMLFTGKLIANR